MARCTLRRLLAAVVVSLVLPGTASAATDALTNPTDQWLPRPDGATWDWAWSDSDYQPQATHEHYTVSKRSGISFELSWKQTDARSGTTPAAGFMDFQQSDFGLVNTNYQSTQPPSQFPILCASAGTTCGNSLAGPMYLLIWGTRSPTLAEPLVKGTRWNSLGGANSDVASANRYAGRERIKTRAFPKGIQTVRVESQITQAGAIGDPYGSGLRTVWWARGVGPVKIVFRHVGGAVTRAELDKTNLRPRPLPPALDSLPLNRGDRATFRWRNSKHMRQWSRQRFTVSQVVNGSARVDVKRLSGPINVVGSYLFSTRLSGITNLAIRTQAQTRATFPPLGPRSGGATGHRHFFTPYDLMTYGFNPVIPAYGAKGQTWHSSPDSKDWQIYGVTGVSKLIGRHRIHTPAGRFRAIGVRSTLRQKGYPFGSGTRTSWFAPGTGLVKLVFRHRDGSVSTVERLKG
jgi:hypothetical protein